MGLYPIDCPTCQQPHVWFSGTVDQRCSACKADDAAVYLAIDTETGGIGEDKSLLTLYIGALNKDFNLVGELDLKIKPADGVYHVTGEALHINGINLVEHDKVAITEADAATRIYEFLSIINPNGKNKLVPVGHNVAFDVRFICSKTLAKKTWDKFVSYRTLDTGTIGQFLITAGKLPPMKSSLGTLAQHFNIAFEAHTAKGDALVCAEILKQMFSLIKE